MVSELLSYFDFTDAGVSLPLYWKTAEPWRCTKDSPPKKVRKEANKIANVLINCTRGKFANQKLREAYEKAVVEGVFVVGLFMDDKILKFEIQMDILPGMSKRGLAEFVFNEMTENKPTVN